MMDRQKRKNKKTAVKKAKKFADKINPFEGNNYKS